MAATYCPNIPGNPPAQLALGVTVSTINRCELPDRRQEAKSRRSLDRRDDLVLEHLPLVKAIAAQYRVKLPAHLDFSDLVHSGIVGLLDAADKYDATAEVSFATYATHRIKGSILDGLRGQDPASRKLRKRHRELEKVRGRLTQELHRDPSDVELAEQSGIELKMLRETMLDVHHLTQMSGSGSAGEPKPTGAPALQPESIVADKQRARLLMELVGRLPETYRSVIILHYETDLSLKEIGGSFGVPERQISRLHQRALLRMNAMLRTRGITEIAVI